MSRSYKYPIFKDKASKTTKRLSSKAIRRWLRTLEIGFKSMKLFRQQINPYDLCDWKIFPIKQSDIEKSKRK